MTSHITQNLGIIQYIVGTVANIVIVILVINQSSLINFSYSD